MREVKLEVTQKFYDNGQLLTEQYLLNGDYHNENGPAFREWNDNGQLLSEQYCLNDVLHNENGPAYREWYDNGQLRSEGYFLNGKCHNENGPAYREWYRSGQLRVEGYFLNGKQLSKEVFRMDGCTESNCPRCRTVSHARGNMYHAGIGDYPKGHPEHDKNSV